MSEYVNLSGTRLLGGLGGGVLFCKNDEAQNREYLSTKVVLQEE